MGKNQVFGCLAAFTAFLIAPPLAVAANAPGAPPSGLTQPPAAIPAGTAIQTTQTVHGKSEVYAYLTQVGFNTASFDFDTGSFQRRSSPFNATSHDVSLEVTQSRVLSATQSPLDVAMNGSAHPAVAPGQTYTTSWTDGCFSYTATYTWEQGSDGTYQWVMTAFSWIRLAQCPAPTG